MNRLLLNRFIRRYASDTTKTTNFLSNLPPTTGPPTTNNDTLLSNISKDDVDMVINPTTDPLYNFHHLEPIPDSEDMRKAVSFEEVPGPTTLKFISKIWSYIPIFGGQVTTSTLQYALSAGKIFGSQLSWGNNLALFGYLINEYGPVVRLHGPFGGDVVILSRPEHAKIVFHSDGPYPIRSSLDCVEKYRLQHRKYRLAGPFIMHGPQWESLRKCIEPALKTSLDYQYNRIALISDDFIKRILAIRNRQQEMPSYFSDEINKWCMECLCSIMFNKQLGFLDPRGLSSTTETAILLDSLKKATKAIRKCEFGLHLWKFFETPAYKKLVLNCDTIDNILGKYLKKTQDDLRAKKNKTLENHDSAKDLQLSLIECLLLKESLLSEDILTILLDMMLLGVNMSAHTAGFLMYHLAKNPRAQHLLYKEIKNLPENVSKEDFDKTSFMKACLHESLRLKPPMPVLSRILSKDISIHGYRIPKGTYILIATNLSSLREEHFEDPLKFRPERWLGMENNKDMEALATLPFGQGPKACLAKDLVEVQIFFLITKILRRFRIEYHYGDIYSNNKLLASPSRPFKFRFVDRT